MGQYNSKAAAPKSKGKNKNNKKKKADKKKGKKQSPKAEEAPLVSEVVPVEVAPVEVVPVEVAPVVAEVVEDPATESEPEVVKAAVEEVVKVETPIKKKKGKKGGVVDDKSKALFDMVTNTDLDQKAAMALVRILTDKGNCVEWKSSDLSPVESKKKIEELTAELEQSKTESSVVSEKLQSAEAPVQSLTSAKAQVDKDLADSLEINTTLKAQMDAQVEAEKSKTVVLESQLKSVNDNEAKFTSLKEENEILKLTIQGNSKTVNDNMKFKVEVASLKEQLKKSQAKMSEATASSDKRQANAASQIATEALSQASSEKDDVQKEMEVLKEKLSSSSESAKEVESLREEVKLLTAQVDESKAADENKIDVAEHNSMLEVRQTEISGLKAELEKATTELKESAESIEKLKNKNNKEADDMAANIQSTLKANLSEAFPNITCEEENFDAWVKAFVSSAASDAATAVAGDAVQEEAKEETNEKLKQQVVALQTSLDSALQLNKNTEAEVEELRREAEAKGSEVESYKAILQATELTLSQLQGRAESEQTDLDRRLKVAKEAWEALEFKLDAANKKVEDQSEELSSVKLEKESLSSEKKEIENKLEELTANLSSDIQAYEQQKSSSPPPSEDETPQSPSPVTVDSQMCISEDTTSGFMVVDHPEGEAAQNASPVRNGNGDSEEIAKLKATE